MSSTSRVKRMGPMVQLAAFLLSAVPFWVGIYWLLPFMVSRGYAIGLALSITVLLPLGLLLIPAIIYARRESDRSLRGMMQRWRLKRMRGSDWLWALFGFGISVACLLLLGNLSISINSRYIGINPPAAFNLIHTGSSFFGMPLSGNWWALLIHFAILIVNIFGEELWFRGILFPKQKLSVGKYAWIAHGTGYYLFHMFYPWDVLRLLPNALAWGWVMQKTDNTWTIIIAHFLFNGIGLVATLNGILS